MPRTRWFGMSVLLSSLAPVFGEVSLVRSHSSSGTSAASLSPDGPAAPLLPPPPSIARSNASAFAAAAAAATAAAAAAAAAATASSRALDAAVVRATACTAAPA
eukprot:scaffold78380_cov61-Phaeocystis_antarctica.AAC.7